MRKGHRAVKAIGARGVARENAEQFTGWHGGSSSRILMRRMTDVRQYVLSCRFSVRSRAQVLNRWTIGAYWLQLVVAFPNAAIVVCSVCGTTSSLPCCQPPNTRERSPNKARSFKLKPVRREGRIRFQNRIPIRGRNSKELKKNFDVTQGKWSDSGTPRSGKTTYKCLRGARPTMAQILRRRGMKKLTTPICVRDRVVLQENYLSTTDDSNIAFGNRPRLGRGCGLRKWPMRMNSLRVALGMKQKWRIRHRAIWRSTERIAIARGLSPASGADIR